MTAKKASPKKKAAPRRRKGLRARRTKKATRMKDEDAIAAMDQIAAALGDDGTDTVMGLGVALTTALYVYECPDVTMDVFRAIANSDKDSDLATKARFAMVGYAIQNYIDDGYDLEKGFLEAPARRSAALFKKMVMR